MGGRIEKKNCFEVNGSPDNKSGIYTDCFVVRPERITAGENGS